MLLEIATKLDLSQKMHFAVTVTKAEIITKGCVFTHDD